MIHEVEPEGEEEDIQPVSALLKPRGERSSLSFGAWRFLRGVGLRLLLGPCPPREQVREDKKVMDLQDPKSASVSAQTE